MYSHGPHIDVIDLDPQPVLGMGSDYSKNLNTIWMDLGVKTFIGAFLLLF
jgi:hypothetical protein